MIFPVNDSLDDDEGLSGDFSPSSGTVSDITGVSGSFQSYKVSFLFFSLEQQITDAFDDFQQCCQDEVDICMLNSQLSGTKWLNY